MTIGARLVRRAAKLPGSLRGALWMILAGFAFTVMWLFGRAAADSGVHPIEVTFFRYLFGLLALSPWAIAGGLGNLRTGHPGRLMVYCVGIVAATICSFVAVAAMPIAEVTALTFTTPLFTTVGAALILKETVRVRRWTAIAIGFLGAMVILRPGLAAFSFPGLIALAGAAISAVALIAIKPVTVRESTRSIVVITSATMAAMALVPALWVWNWPTATQLLWLAGTGAFGSLGIVGLTRAFRAAEATAVLPFDFAKLLFAAGFGYALFDEWPDRWIWAGAAIIFGAVLYTAHREVMLARAARGRS